MTAYVVVEVDVTDPQGYEEYKKLAAPTVTNAGGKYIVRGGNAQILEGDWCPKRFVILEFPSVEMAKAWWHSEEYTPIKQIRQRTTHSKMIVVEGVEGTS